VAFGAAAAFSWAWLSRGNVSDAPRAEVAPSASPREQLRRGVWGELRVNTILLEPPVEAIDDISGDCSRLSSPWEFLGYDASGVDAIGISLSDPRTASAMHEATVCAKTGCSVSLAIDARAAMPAPARARLYPLLARLDNMEFSGAIKLQSANVDEWLYGALARPEDRAYARSFFFEDGGRQSFADAEIVCRRLGTLDARRKFVRALFASEALLAHIRVAPGQSIEPLLEYWAPGHRRRKNIEPILRSLALDPAGGEIDVSHVLTSFARKLLYAYPNATEEQLNCHWTTLNFALPEPSATFLDNAVAVQAFDSDYQPIDASAVRYGDAVLLSDGSGKLVHSAIYVADDIVFTKNGRSMKRPWILARLQEIRAGYPNATSTKYLRRKPVMGNAN
jgi:hypothetical protein